ncbi:MAG: DsbA family protein [Pseudomonadales bacterium]
MSEPEFNAPPYQFRAPLTVCIDVRQPQAYLALQPTLALAAELDLLVDWLPFAVAPLKAPAAAAPDEDRGTRHRRIRAEYQAAEIRRYAAVQGIQVGDGDRDLYRAPDATLAGAAQLWLREHAPQRMDPFLRRLFAGYWGGGLDLEDLPAVSAVIADMDADGPAFARFAAGPGPELLAGMRDQLVAAGVFAVPSFVVAGEVFVGRAHLPMVRWLLQGRVGPPPI